MQKHDYFPSPLNRLSILILYGSASDSLSSFLLVLAALAIAVGIVAPPLAVAQQSSSVAFVDARAGLTDVELSSSSIADVNGDDNPDLVIAGVDINFVPKTTLYLGDGQGGFTSVSAGMSGVGLGSTSIADVNGDGNPDILITGLGRDNRIATVYLGDGQGGFTEAEAGLTGVELSSSSIADINGDSNPDLLITGRAPNIVRTTTLYLGDGQGGFTEAGAGLTGVARGSSSIADIDGDGNPDLLITGLNENSTPTTTLYLGDGQGGFTEAGAGLTGVTSSSSSIADVDGNGNPDLLITGRDVNYDTTATLYLGDGRGGFTEAGAGFAGVVDGSSSVADINSDGNPDVLITGREADHTPTSALYLGDGQGGFTEAGLDLIEVAKGSNSIADINSDGRPDVLITGRSNSEPASALYLGDSSTPPTDVEATAGDGQVDVSWTYPKPITFAGFHVYRSTSSFSDPANAERLTNVPISDDTYTDTDVVNGTTYFYRVTMVETDGSVTLLNTEASATPTASGASQTLQVGALTLRADEIVNTSGSVHEATGNVSLNNILQFTGTVTADTETRTFAGDGSIFLTQIPDVGEVELYRGVYNYQLEDDLTQKLKVISAPNSVLRAANLRVLIDAVEVLDDGVRVEGDLQLPPIFDNVGAAVEAFEITRSGGRDIAGTIEVTEAPLFKGVATVKSLQLTFDGAENRFSGNGRLETSQLALEAGAELLDGQLNSLGVEIEVSPPVPIASTGLGLSGGGGGIEGLQEPPQTLFVSADITPVTGSLETVTFDDLTLSYTLGERLEGSGRIKVFDRELGGASFAAETQSLSFNGDATFSAAGKQILEGQLGAGINQVSTGYDVSGQLNAQLVIPRLKDGFPYDWLETIVEFPYPVAQTENHLQNTTITGEVQVAFVGLAYGLAYVDSAIEAEFARNMENLNQDLFPLPALQLSKAERTSNRFEGQSLIMDSEREITGQAYATTDTTRQEFTLDTIQSELVIRVQGSGSTPSFSVTLPGGRTVSASEASSEITFTTDDATGKSFAAFGSPSPGAWSVNVPSGEQVAVDVIGADPAPTLDISVSGQGGASSKSLGETIALSWRAEDNDPLTVDLFYDDDAAGQDGTLIASDVSGGSYDWSTADLAPGTYYIYTRASDAVNTPTVRYATTPVRVAPSTDLAPPTEFDAAVRDTVLDVSWIANTDASSYTLFYDEGNDVDFDSPSLPVGDTTTVTLDRIASGRTYTLALAARNTAGDYSPLSTPQTVAFTRSSENNPPKLTSLSPPETGRSGESYSYTFAAEDVDGDPLTFSLLRGPDGMTMGAGGSLSWTAEPGVYGVRVQVTDDNGAADSLSYQVRITDVATSRATLAFSLPTYVGPDALGSLTLRDIEQNTSSARIDSVDLTVTSKAGRVDLRLYETSANSANFAAAFGFQSSADRPSLAVQDIDTLQATYTDPYPSAEVSTQAAYEIRIAPLAPTNVNARQRPDRAEIQWAENTEADLAGYRVYRSTTAFSASDGVNPVTNNLLSDPTFVDTTVAIGTTYYYRVAAVDNDGNEGPLSTLQTVFLYPETVGASISRSFDGASQASDYRLISVPGGDAPALSAILNGEAGKSWQAYWDDGSETDFFVPHDESERFRMAPGRGFWVTRLGDWEREIEASTVRLRGDTVAVIDLHDGWNIISNPTDKDVAWTAVDAMHPNTALQTPWAFRGAFAQTDTIASATSGEAYYFLNASGLDSLAIPYPGAPFSSRPLSPQSASQDDVPTLHLTAILSRAKGSGTGDESTETVRVSLSESATVGPDNLDQVGPPGRFSSLSLRLNQPKRGNVSVPVRQRKLAHEWRPMPPEGYRFDIDLSASREAVSSDTPIYLVLEGMDHFPLQHASLLHPAAQASYDLEDGKAEISLFSESEQLQLVVGSADYVRRKTETIAPGELALTSYPNPARSDATVEYSLPEAGDVTLVLYDVLGRRVARLVDGSKRAGRHRVALPTAELASGVYFGRLKTEDQQVTQKIVIVR